MKVHARNRQQKKDTAYHIVSGTICKNCRNYSNTTQLCYGEVITKPVDEYGYCSRFERKED